MFHTLNHKTINILSKYHKKLLYFNFIKLNIAIDIAIAILR